MADVTHPGDVVTKSGIRLPAWLWAVLAGATLGGGYLFYRHRKSAAADAAQTSAAQSPALSGGAAGPDNGAGFSTPTAILPIFQGTQPATKPFPVLQYENPPTPVAGYTVSGKTSPSDQYPAGVAVAAYKLPRTSSTVPYYAVLISLENIGYTPPYPVGTKLRIPAIPASGASKAYSAAQHPDQTSPPTQTASGTYTPY